MPYSYEIDHGRRLVAFTGIGPLTDAEVLAQSETLSADPEFHPEYSELNNLMEANVIRARPRRCGSECHLGGQ